MCNPMSGVITRERVLWDEWTDSHSEILKNHDLVDDSEMPDFVKFELVPPGGDYSLPFEKWRYQEDQEDVPEWYNRENAEAAARTVLPLWAATHLITTEGATVDLSGIKNPSIVVLSKKITVIGQQGGEVRAYGSSTVQSSGQQGGEVRAYDASTVRSTGQQGGLVRAYDASTVLSTGQQGGLVWAYGSSTVQSSGQQGGEVWAYGSYTVQSSGQQGGEVQACCGKVIIIN